MRPDAVLLRRYPCSSWRERSDIALLAAGTRCPPDDLGQPLHAGPRAQVLFHRLGGIRSDVAPRHSVGPLRKARAGGSRDDGPTFLDCLKCLTCIRRLLRHAGWNSLAAPTAERRVPLAGGLGMCPVPARLRTCVVADSESAVPCTPAPCLRSRAVRPARAVRVGGPAERGSLLDALGRSCGRLAIPVLGPSPSPSRGAHPPTATLNGCNARSLADLDIRKPITRASPLRLTNAERRCATGPRCAAQPELLRTEPIFRHLTQYADGTLTPCHSGPASFVRVV